MKLSVVVPVYNTPIEYLIPCLDSIRNQDESDFEVIIVDDGSIVETAQLLDKYAQGDTRFKVFHKENEGVSKARNYGIEQASGEFISFVDADDYVDRFMISYAFKIQRQYDADMVMWQCDQVINGKSKAVFYQGNGIDVFDDTNKEILSELVLDGNAYYGEYYWNSLICTWGKMYRTELVKNIKFPENIKINEDGLYIFQAIQKCHKLVITDNILYHYVQWGGSTGHAMKLGIVQNWIQNRREYMGLIRQESFSEKVYWAYDKNAIMPVKFILFNIWANSENKGRYRRIDFVSFINQREIKDSIKRLKLWDFKKLQDKLIFILLKMHCYYTLLLLVKIRIAVLRKKEVCI